MQTAWHIATLFVATAVVLSSTTAVLCDEVVAVSVTVESRNDPANEPIQKQALSLTDLEAMARQHNPTLAFALARMQAARGEQVQAGLYPNPVLGYHAVEMGLRGTDGQQGAFVSQRMITARKRQLDQAIAGQDVRAAHFRFHAQEQRVLSDVRIRFYESLVAQRRVQLTEELSRIGNALVAATETLVDGRQSTENDLLQAEIRADEAHILLDNARNEYVEAWRRLMAVVGVPNMEQTQLTGMLDHDLPFLNWDTCLENLLGSHPELSAARTRIQRARMVIERERREPIPNIDLTVSHRYHNVTGDNVTNVQVGIPVPIFDKNQGNIGAAQADLIAACRDVERMELVLRDQLAVAYRRYANARQQVDRYSQRMVPRAEKSLSLVSEGYRKGQVEYLTLLTAQQTYLQVSLSYLDSLRELRTAVSAIDGQLLVESLAGRP